MGSKYIDTVATIQVIGNVFINPQLLEITDKYTLTDEDFPNDFHKIVFGAIYKLYESGVSKISIISIVDFLSSRPKSNAIFQSQKGEEWLQTILTNIQKEAFDYYYSRLKKFSLLRAYDAFGIDVTEIYDPDNIFDSTKHQKQEEFLDNHSLEQIADIVDNKIEQIRMQFVDNNYEDSIQAGNEIFDLIDRYKQYPEVGVPLYGPLINTITRGARLKKFYIRSAATGTGKTRSMIADACYIGCNKIYDESFGWIKTGAAQPTLFIATEQEKEEIQTMMLAFLSNVNEDHILTGKYIDDEESRVREAAKILQESQLYIDELPDFSLQDVENRIKKNIREHNVLYVFFDYIQSSMKILEEITKRSGGVKLREDNILFMLSTRLKDLCNIYGVFILSGTQLNANYQDSETPDQNLLRGAKSIGDKVDVGLIMLKVREHDVKALEPLLSTFEKPEIKISVYKNRRGGFTGIYLWCKANLSTCRIIPMFATGWDYQLININETKIILKEESAF